MAAPDVERVITSHYHSKCHDCGMPIAPGEECVYLGKISKVRHLEGMCANEYQVKCQYRATSKILRIKAADAEQAADKAAKECGKASRKAGCSAAAMKGRGKDTPDVYIVYLDGVEQTRRFT